MILDHNKRPRNFCKPKCTNRIAEGINPLCGDQLTVYLDVEDGVVKDIGFSGTGCAISTASASLMTQTIKGMKIEEAELIKVRNDLKDQVLIVENDTYDRLEKLLTVQVAEGGPVGLKLGFKVSRRYLTPLPAPQGFEFRIR